MTPAQAIKAIDRVEHLMRGGQWGAAVAGIDALVTQIPDDALTDTLAIRINARRYRLECATQMRQAGQAVPRAPWLPPPEERTMPEEVKAPEAALKEKRCKGPCGRLRPLDEFHLVPENRDGHDGTCRECRRERAAKLRRDKAQAAKAAPLEVPREDTCNVVTPLDDFSKVRQMLDTCREPGPDEPGDRTAAEVDPGGISFTEGAWAPARDRETFEEILERVRAKRAARRSAPAPAPAVVPGWWVAAEAGGAALLVALGARLGARR